MKKPKTDKRRFTGLKDKNGRDIYEGDIVHNGYEGGVVIFKEGAYTVKIHKNFIHKSKYDRIPFFQWVLDNYFRETSSELFEIVGNIYENKELLVEKR